MDLLSTLKIMKAESESIGKAVSAAEVSTVLGCQRSEITVLLCHLQSTGLRSALL